MIIILIKFLKITKALPAVWCIETKLPGCRSSFHKLSIKRGIRGNSNWDLPRVEWARNAVYLH